MTSELTEFCVQNFYPYIKETVNYMEEIDNEEGSHLF